LLQRIGQLAMPKAMEMARQLCAGVAAAHERGVLHRDLKPSNIMVDGRGQIRIMDFGLAVTVMADVREVAGTPAYMAPEQLVGGPVTTSSDLYSLGRVLEEILPPGISPEVTSAIHACLERDPAKRPRSASAVAATLPHADSLVLSDGGIPSPAMVAAAPTAGTLPLTAAWFLLGGVVGGSIAIAGVHGFTITPSELPKPPEVLAERARNISSDTGPRMTPAADRTYWWWRADTDDRIRFTYRESSALLIPANLFRDVTAHDPPHDPTSMRMVTLEADGTPSTATPPPRTVWVPPTAGINVGELLYWIIILTTFVATCILARRNLRAGEGDRSGAWRLGIVVSCGSIIAAALRAHHVPSVIAELSWLFGVSGWALLWGAFSWLAYISFEPYSRRWWPHMLVSWTRVLTGRVLDPLVGRDLLIGSCVGVILTAVDLIHIEFADHSAPAMLFQSALWALRSPTAFGGVVIGASLNALVTSLCSVAVLVLFRLIVKSTSIALILLVIMAVPIFATSTSLFEVGVTVGLLTLGLVVLLRFGVVALVAMSILTRLLTWLPLTLDTDAWYFGRSLTVLLSIAALATYGFLVALGGRPAFGMMEPE
jgi:hypothetical protein